MSTTTVLSVILLSSFIVFTSAEPNCTLNEYYATVCTLDPETVHYIDSYLLPNGQYNFLFRGNMPKNSNNEFAYDELKQILTTKAAEVNMELPSTYFLMDISFLLFVEQSDLELEQNYFAANPSQGQVINYSLMGMCMGAEGLPDSVRIPMSTTLVDWTWDDLPIFVNTIRNYLITPRDIPVVVYMHCEAGKDRTGEASGAYYLQYLKWDFDQVVQFNYESSPERQISPDMLNGVQWFCYYLHDTMGYDVDCSLPSSYMHIEIEM